MNHVLKLNIRYWSDVKSGVKDFEIRKNDRGFKLGDTLELKAYRDADPHYVSSILKDTIIATENPEDADTIKVKVTQVMSAKRFNQLYADNLIFGHPIPKQNFNFKKVLAVQWNYFGTNRIHSDYVVLAIEVLA